MISVLLTEHGLIPWRSRRCTLKYHLHSPVTWQPLTFFLGREGAFDWYQQVRRRTKTD